MQRRVSTVADQLLLIERELRVLGWWEASPPDARALASQQPFCVDTLELHQWLQWIFLPRMKLLVEGGQPLPTTSGIHAMAEVVYAQRLAEVRELLKALAAFDRLISAGN